MTTGVLLLENGVSGGGSFEAVQQLVDHLDRTKFRPVVAFVNETHFLTALLSRGERAYLLRDPLYSVNGSAAAARFQNRAVAAVDRYLPGAGVYAERRAHAPTMKALETIAREESIDVLHLNNHALRDFYGVVAAKRLGIPSVSHLRSVRVGSVNGHKIDFLNAHVSRFIANSDFTRRHWVSLGLDDAKVATVHNAIGAVDVAPLDVRREWGITSRFVIGCVGNLTDSKGQALLLRAFAHVLAHEPDCTLVLVGDGPHRDALTALSRELHVDRSVVFAGYDRRAKAIIAALDVLVSPSVQESFGRTLLEAMAAGTPIVAVRSGGVPEVIEHDVNGLLTEVEDAQGLSAAIVGVLHDPALAKRLVERGRAICRDRFGLAQHVRRIEDIYAAARRS